MNTVDNGNISAGDIILGLSSSGQTTYELEYNSGIGSNGLTAARHDIFHHKLAEEFPNSFNPFSTGSLVWGSDEIYVITNVPPDIREHYAQLYFENWNKRYNQDFKKILDYLDTVPYDEELMHTMMKDVKLRDIHRGTCLLDLAPEWKPYYE